MTGWRDVLGGLKQHYDKIVALAIVILLLVSLVYLAIHVGLIPKEHKRWLHKISLFVPGFVGALPADGRATTSLQIPGLAGLTGLTFELGMLTLQHGLGVAEEISDVTPVTILP